MEWLSQAFADATTSNPLLAVLLAFVGGVAAGFTPCAYPMLPITVAFVGSRARGRRWRGFLLSALYVLGLAVVYAALGAFAALSGRLFGSVGSSPWVYLFMGNLCLVFSLVMLEVIPLRSPAFLSRIQVRQVEGSDLLTSVLLGGVSALVVGACTTPILAVLLGYVATRQSIVLGVAMLFAFGYGLGSLVILVGTFTAVLSSLPRAGRWMNLVQKGFGLVMLLAAEYFLIKTGEFWI